MPGRVSGLCALSVLLGCALSPAAKPARAAQPSLVTGKGVHYRPAPRAAPPAVKAPNDPLFRFQWNLAAIQVPAAWAVSRGAGATVAVLDTGVAYEDRGIHRRAPDLAGTRFVPGWDFVAGDAHPDDVAVPGRRSHGTQMAGIIAQTTGNGIGAAGVAPEAAIMPIRVLRPDLSGSARAIARGLRFAADHGANVANLSIAGSERSRALRAAVDYASAKGVTVVAAAGNDGRGSVSFPAAYPQVIAVGAVAQDRTRAHYSNYGRALDLVAPGGAGEDVDSGFGPGDGVVAQTLRGGPSTFCYCFSASTSAAAAHVSGVAALLVGSGRATTPRAVRAALLAGAQDLGPAGWDPQYGAGLVQAWSALAAVGPVPGVRSAPSAQRSSDAGRSPGTRRRSAGPGRRSSGPTWVVWGAAAIAAALAAAAALRFARARRRPPEG